MNIFKILGTLLGLLLLFSCNKNEQEEKYSHIPALKLTSQNTNTISYTDSTSMLTLNFEFTDGDGDIAKRSPDGDTTIVVKIHRLLDTTNTRYLFPMPTVAASEYQNNGGIKGYLRLDMTNNYFYPRNDTAHASGLDTMHLGIYIQDYAGNQSDTVLIGPIYIQP